MRALIEHVGLLLVDELLTDQATRQGGAITLLDRLGQLLPMAQQVQLGVDLLQAITQAGQGPRSRLLLHAPLGTQLRHRLDGQALLLSQHRSGTPGRPPAIVAMLGLQYEQHLASSDNLALHGADLHHHARLRRGECDHSVCRDNRAMQGLATGEAQTEESDQQQDHRCHQQAYAPTQRAMLAQHHRPEPTALPVVHCLASEQCRHPPAAADARPCCPPAR